MTFTTILPVSFAFYCLRAIVLQAPFGLTFAQQSIWLLLPTVMALVIAFACDNYAQRRADPAWLVWAEALGIGGIIASCGLLVNRMQEQVGVSHHRPVIIPIVIGAAMGALFGSTIPRWYRRTLRQTETAPTSGTSDVNLSPVRGDQTGREAIQAGLAD